MFERFTEEAREVVVHAQEEARRLRHQYIGTEHLLLGLVDQETSTAAVLARHGVTRQSVIEAVRAFTSGDGLDAAALGTVGIDLDVVRNTVEATFGPGALDVPGRGHEPKGHIPFSGRAKKVLELSLREARALKSTSIGGGHLALGLIREGEGLAMKVIHDLGVDAESLRQEIRTSLGA
jgi:ATP-dependent Clp protease ATP-binding subunit ClpA